MVLRAYAKLNLTLDIVGKREDGYHLIDSVFQSVGVYDTVTVEKYIKTSVVCGGLSGEKNIAFKAADRFFEFAGIKGGARIEISKNIPVCAGLGGGSADAAAVIIALNTIYGTNLKKSELAEIGLSCGADIPFFIYGGTARVGGIGEEVSPVNAIEDCFAVIIKEGEKQSTGDMYKRLDSMPDTNKKTERFLKLLKEKGSAEALKISDNAFGALCADKALIKVLKSQNPVCVSVSGSGPSHFAVFDNENAADTAARVLKKEGYEPLVAPFKNRAIDIIE